MNRLLLTKRRGLREAIGIILVIIGLFWFTALIFIPNYTCTVPYCAQPNFLVSQLIAILGLVLAIYGLVLIFKK